MSLSTSKSKTQLAYARSTKPTNKPKSKNSSVVQTADSSKNRNGPRNSTGNIYDSIMGQIEPKQQDYIKSLIVKNEKEVIRQEKQSVNGGKQGDSSRAHTKNEIKKSLNNSAIMNSPPPASVFKVLKQPQTPLKKPSTLGVHQRTRSHAQLTIQDSGIPTSGIETSNSIVHLPQEKQITEISCNDSQGEGLEEAVSSKGSRVKVVKQSSSKEMMFRLSQSTMGESVLEKIQGNPKEMMMRKQPNTMNSATAKNPIIQALNNTSSSFAKKLQVFELQYPLQQRQQRSTHKKVPSKLSVQYFSCQTSPKNNKNIYTKQIVVTTKPTNNDYQPTINRQQSVSANISPISSTKNSNQKSHKKAFESSQPTIATNFISCLDDYLQALTYNSTVSETVQQNSRPVNNNVSMKRSNSSKFKEFSTSKGHPFTLGEEEQQEETVVLGNGNYTSNPISKLKLQQSTKLLSYSQQQKLIKQLTHHQKKVTQMTAIIQMFHQQHAKYKKKQKKLKQNQYDMIAVMKELNQQLTQQRDQRRKLQGVVSQFQWKIRGISRGKDKARRDSGENDQRPERKTIYGSSSIGNSIHFNQNHKHNAKLQKHSKKPSFNRLSSMINSVSCNNNNCHDDMSYEPQQYRNDYKLGEQGFFKNKTQKFSKIISNFELENQPCDEEDEMYFRSRNYNHGNERKSNNERQQVMRDSLKNTGYPQPTSCKHSYMNSSMPLSTKSKSRPMTSKLVQQLFRSTTNKSKNQEYQTKNYSSSQEQEESYQDTSREYMKEHFDQDGGYEQDSQVRQTQTSVDQGVMDGGYEVGVIKRMR